MNSNGLEKSETTSILEIQNEDTKTWQAVGSISLNNSACSDNEIDTTDTHQKQQKQQQQQQQQHQQKQQQKGEDDNHKKLLPLGIKNILCPNAKVKSDRRAKYMYRHSHDKIDTNLLILLHGAGDSHLPYHEFAKKMKLPQTATLCVNANAMGSVSGSNSGFVTLPFDLGHTWFEEMDYTTGEPLKSNDARRLKSLESACNKFDTLLLDAIINHNTSDAAATTELWIPERIFLFGFSSGACLAMNICYNRMKQGKLPLGGAVCVAGGLRGTTLQLPDLNSSKSKRNDNECTPILLMGGGQDASYTTSLLKADAKLYNSICSSKSDLVKTFVQPGKGHDMVKHQAEIKCMMEFFAEKMVRRMIAMEGWSEVATASG